VYLADQKTSPVIKVMRTWMQRGRRSGTVIASPTSAIFQFSDIQLVLVNPAGGLAVHVSQEHIKEHSFQLYL
jgi:hypothetical protein